MLKITQEDIISDSIKLHFNQIKPRKGFLFKEVLEKYRGIFDSCYTYHSKEILDILNYIYNDIKIMCNYSVSNE